MKGLTEVLAEHEATFTEVDGHEWRWRCRCKASGGAISPRPEVTAKRAHRTHVGEAIDDKIRERLAGAREDVVLAINAGVHWDTGALDSAPDDVLAAVAEALGVGEVRG